MSFDRVNVYEIMRKPIISVHPNMNIRLAINLISRFKLSPATVLDGDQNLLGIVTLREMVLR
ncbi:MAG: CBS domain-containing protein [Pseudomonadota bacterium]|nr:CBS domain-containing protein [Pseudomonadota bacterium]